MRRVGPEVSDDRTQLEQSVDGDLTVFRLQSGDPKSDVHDQRDRVFEFVDTKNYAQSFGVSHTGCGDETGIHGAGENLTQMDDAVAALESDAEPAGD